MQQIAKKVYDKTCEELGNQEEKDSVDTMAIEEVQNVFEKAGEENKQYAKKGQMSVFWKNTSKGALRIIGATVGGTIGMVMSMPGTGAYAGYMVGHVLGEFICTIQ